jgi:YfiH family protein
MNTKILHQIPSIFPNDKIIAGITQSNFDTFPPLGFSINETDYFDTETVENNRLLLAKELSTTISNFVFQKQIHSNNINIVKKGFPRLDSDGMMTNEKGIFLITSLADCCGILVYDKKKEIIAALHSGWRGTEQGISKEAIRLLIDKYHSNPQDLLVWITPCAGAEDYEVGWDVAKFFPNNIIAQQNGKYLLDLKSVITKQLVDKGVCKHNIQASSESTISNLNYHSFRRDKDNSGRMAAFIAMIDD